MKVLNNFLSYFNTVINQQTLINFREVLLILICLTMGVTVSIYNFIAVSIPFGTICIIGLILFTIVEYRSKEVHPNPDILAIGSILSAIVLVLNSILYTNISETTISLFILGSYGTTLYITLIQLIYYALQKRRIST